MLFILTGNRGDFPCLSQSFIHSALHGQGTGEFWQGSQNSVSRLELSCLFAEQRICSCKSHRIRGHRTGTQPAGSHGSTAGLILLCAVQIWSLIQHQCALISKVFLKPIFFPRVFRRMLQNLFCSEAPEMFLNFFPSSKCEETFC